jgi:hypothetical protein
MSKIHKSSSTRAEGIMTDRKKIIALGVSVAAHAALVGAIIFHDALSLYRSVEGLEIGDYGGRASVRLINPADYGYGRKPALAAPPRRAARLDEIKKRAKPVEEQEKETDDETARDAQSEADQRADEVAQERTAERKPLTFGRVDTGPIKQHVNVLWQAYEQGTLDVPENFRITAACKVNEDGSFSGIRLVESSGSDEIDRTALAILQEIGNQRAFAPLSRLSSVSVRLEVGPGSASFSIVGFAQNAALADDMAGQYRLMVSAAKLLASNSQAKQLLSNTVIQNDASRVTARLTLPRSAAAQMMAGNFSKPV